MNKQEVEAHAKRLNIDISGMSGNQMKSVVSAAIKKEKIQQSSSLDIQRLLAENAKLKAANKAMRVKYEDEDPGRAPTKKEIKEMDIEIAPYISPNGSPGIPKGVAKEKLGQDVIYDTDSGFDEGAPEKVGEYVSSFNHRGYTNDRVIGTRADPCFNPGQIKRAGEVFRSVYIGDKHNPSKEEYRGADVRYHIMQINNGIYLDKFHDQFYGNHNNGYKGAVHNIMGMYTIPKHVTHRILLEITKEERKRMLEEQKGLESLNG